MRQSVIGTVISIIVMFVSLIVLPTYFVGVINWRTDMNTCQTAARNFVDMVIDNGQITEKALSDLNLTIAGCSGDYSYEYYREEKIVNPVVGSDSEYVVTYVHTEVDTSTVWHPGDIVTIVITQQSPNLFQRLSNALLNTSYNNFDLRLSGMVR